MTLFFATLPAIAALLPGALGIALVHHWDQKTRASNNDVKHSAAASQACPESVFPRPDASPAIQSGFEKFQIANPTVTMTNIA